VPDPPPRRAAGRRGAAHRRSRPRRCRGARPAPRAPRPAPQRGSQRACGAPLTRGATPFAAQPCGDLLPAAPAPAAGDAAPAGGKKGGKKGQGKPKTAADEGAGEEGGGGGAVLQLRQVWTLACDAPVAPTLSYRPDGGAGGPASVSATLDVLALCRAAEPLAAAAARLRAVAHRQAAALAELLKSDPAARPVQSPPLPPLPPAVPGRGLFPGSGARRRGVRPHPHRAARRGQAALHFDVSPHLPFPVCLALPLPAADAPEKNALGPDEAALRPTREVRARPAAGTGAQACPNWPDH